MNPRLLALRFLFMVGATAFLFSLRDLIPIGADGPYMATLIEQQTVPMYYRSLLTLWLHKCVYVCTAPLGFDGHDAIALSSAIAGAIAIQALWALCPRALFLVVNIPTGSFLVFCGHVENYAWVNAFLLLTILFTHRWLRDKERIVVSVALYMLACLSHMLAIWYLPAMLYLWMKARRSNPLEILVPIILFAAIVMIASVSGRVGGTEIGLERFVPWFDTWAPNHYFTFLSAHHIEMLFYFHTHAAWLGIPIELPLLGLVLLRYIETTFERFLLIATLCGLVWTTLWHPDWGPMDWDLFSQFAIPLHVLLGWLLCKRLCPLPDKVS